MTTDFSGIKLSFGGGARQAVGHVRSNGPDPMADPAKLAAIGNRVRATLEANPDAENLGGDKADLFRIPGFLSRTECRRVCKVIDAKIGPSTLFRGTEIDGFRTSSTHYFDRDDPLTADLEKRIDSVLGLDHSHAETTQGQRYEKGQQFKHHYDYFFQDQDYWATERRRGGQRSWTAMVFLNEPEAGGETDFRNLDLAVTPERGTLLTWNNMDRDGRPNQFTFHAGTPVQVGSKYVITQWYRQDPFLLQPR